MQLNINSKTYGNHVVHFDEKDAPEVLNHRWRLKKGYATFYCVTHILKDGKKTTLLMHRMIMKAETDVVVDHRDSNGLNNARSNLRICTNAQNISNRRKNSNNTSGYKGVRWYSETNKWRAEIYANGKLIIGGYFEDKIEAAQRYNELAIHHHGEFAHLNKI